MLKTRIFKAAYKDMYIRTCGKKSPKNCIYRYKIMWSLLSKEHTKHTPNNRVVVTAFDKILPRGTLCCSMLNVCGICFGGLGSRSLSNNYCPPVTINTFVLLKYRHCFHNIPKSTRESLLEVRLCTIYWINKSMFGQVRTRIWT